MEEYLQKLIDKAHRNKQSCIYYSRTTPRTIEQEMHYLSEYERLDNLESLFKDMLDDKEIDEIVKINHLD